MTHLYPNLINGELITTADSLEVVNPANEQVIGRVPACGAAELDRAVAAARAAFKTWSKTPVDDRRAVIRNMAAAIEANFDELYRLLTSEVGWRLRQIAAVDSQGHQVSQAIELLKPLKALTGHDCWSLVQLRAFRILENFLATGMPNSLRAMRNTRSRKATSGATTACCNCWR